MDVTKHMNNTPPVRLEESETPLSPADCSVLMNVTILLRILAEKQRLVEFPEPLPDRGLSIADGLEEALAVLELVQELNHECYENLRETAGDFIDTRLN